MCACSIYISISRLFFQVSHSLRKHLFTSNYCQHSLAEDQQIFIPDKSNFTLNQQVIQNPPGIYFEVEDFFSDFIFYIDNFFIKQQIRTKKQILYNNGFSDLTGVNLLFVHQNSGDNLNYTPEINLSNPFQNSNNPNRIQSNIYNT